MYADGFVCVLLISIYDFYTVEPELAESQGTKAGFTVVYLKKLITICMFQNNN